MRNRSSARIFTYLDASCWWIQAKLITKKSIVFLKKIRNSTSPTPILGTAPKPPFSSKVGSATSKHGVLSKERPTTVKIICLLFMCSKSTSRLVHPKITSLALSGPKNRMWHLHNLARMETFSTLGKSPRKYMIIRLVSFFPCVKPQAWNQGVRTPPPPGARKKKKRKKRKRKERKKKEKNVLLDHRQRFCWSEVNRFDRGKISC